MPVKNTVVTVSNNEVDLDFDIKYWYFEQEPLFGMADNDMDYWGYRELRKIDINYLGKPLEECLDEILPLLNKPEDWLRYHLWGRVEKEEGLF